MLCFIHLQVLCLSVAIGHVDMSEDELVANVYLAVNFLVSLLKKNWQNVWALYIKSTMGNLSVYISFAYCKPFIQGIIKTLKTDQKIYEFVVYWLKPGFSKCCGHKMWTLNLCTPILGFELRRFKMWLEAVNFPQLKACLKFKSYSRFSKPLPKSVCSQHLLFAVIQTLFVP